MQLHLFYFKFKERVNVKLRSTAADKHCMAGDGRNKVSLELEILLIGARCLWLVMVVVCSQAPNSNSEYPAFLESLGGVLEGVPARDSGPAEGFGCYCGRSGETTSAVIVRHGLSDLNQSSFSLLEFVSAIDCP